MFALKRLITEVPVTGEDRGQAITNTTELHIYLSSKQWRVGTIDEITRIVSQYVGTRAILDSMVRVYIQKHKFGGQVFDRVPVFQSEATSGKLDKIVKDLETLLCSE